MRTTLLCIGLLLHCTTASASLFLSLQRTMQQAATQMGSVT